MIDLFEMAPTFDDPIGMLRACHRRIERALNVLGKVAACEREGDLDAPAHTALRQILHYFRTGVPRHAKDEEESLFPRLREALRERNPSALRALEALEREHTVADLLHRELEALGEQLLQLGRFTSVTQRDRFIILIAALQELYREHIRLEDDEILPLADAIVNAAERDAVGTEMAFRRGIDREQHRHAVSLLGSRPRRAPSEPSPGSRPRPDKVDPVR